MLHSIEMGWFIINKYYNRTDEVPVYAAALLLDPSRRIAHLQKNWDHTWIPTAVADATTIWEEDYKSRVVPHVEAVVDEAQAQLSRPLNELDRLIQEGSVVVDMPEHDDFNVFINAPPIKTDCTPLEWWCQASQRVRYPKLSAMAIAILSIPPESAEAERVFSGARRSCAWYRLRLSCGSIQLIECIGSWMRQGLIRPLADDGMGLPISPLDDEVIPGFTDEVIDEIRWFELE
jgi:hypothetical protein